MDIKKQAKQRVENIVKRVEAIENHVKDVLKTEFEFDVKYVKLGDPSLPTITGVASEDNKVWYPFELGDRGVTFGAE